MNRACNLGSAVSNVLCLAYNLVKFTLFITLFKRELLLYPDLSVVIPRVNKLLWM